MDTVRLVGKPVWHGFYQDKRSPTGLTFYCRTEDWHREETMTENGLWMVAGGKAP